MRLRRSRLLALLGGALVVVASFVSCGSSTSEPAALSGYVRDPSPNLSDLTLPSVSADGSSEPFAMVGPSGGLLVVYAGYTSCPDVCPTTLADTRIALNQIGDKADDVQVAMVTIDPEVDTPEVLVNYVQSFVPDAVALRTLDDPELREVAGALGADYGTTTNDDGEEEVFHTGSLYAIDDAGNLVVTWPFGTTPTQLTDDLSVLLDRAANPQT